MTCPSLRNPRSLRQRDSAHWSSLNILSSMVSRFRQPRVVRVRWRIVAKVDSIGLVVRMLCQCSAGKSKKFISSSRSRISFTAALGYWSWQRARKRSKARLAWSRVSAIRICCSADFTLGWMAFGIAASTLAVLCTRQCWCRPYHPPTLDFAHSSILKNGVLQQVQSHVCRGVSTPDPRLSAGGNAGSSKTMKHRMLGTLSWFPFIDLGKEALGSLACLIHEVKCGMMIASSRALLSTITLFSLSAITLATLQQHVYPIA